VKQTKCRNVLILSPDTDVYHIGMALDSTHSKQVVVQISPVNSRQLKFLDITTLNAAFQNDPDLANIDAIILPQILFVCTGCDYISFFSRIGKATLLRYFFSMLHS